MNWIKNPPGPGLEVVNWAEVTSQAELLTWVPEAYLLHPDRRGRYRLTGYEEKGRCWWCGHELTGKQRRWCTRFQLKADQGHWIDYYNHFCWPYARSWCIERQEGRCANWWTPYNLPWNLIGFCHECHLEAHAAMRPERLPPDPWQARISMGQLPLIEELLKEVNHATIS